MARSKWNTGTLLNKVEAVADEVQSTVSSGGEKLPKWQALVNTAADAMDVVSDTWTDVSGAVSEMLPDQEYVNETVGAAVENVKERAGIVSDAVSKASTIFKAATSPVGLNFLNDVMLSKFEGRVAGTEVFTQGGVDLMRKLVLDAGILEKGSVTINKEVYNNLVSGISVNQSGGSSGGEIVKALAEGNPANEIKLMLGQFTAEIDENGDIIVTDQFNYNDFVNPIDGKTYNPEEYDEAIEQGKFTQLEVLMSIFSGEMNYKMVRAAGFVLGSRDYAEDVNYVKKEGDFSGKNNAKDRGRQFKINLGPAS